MRWLRDIGYSLFTEDMGGKRKVSLGRLCFTVVFLHGLVMWSFGHEIPEGELSTLWILLGYVAGSKINETVRALKS